ncbi:hypothetical protein [Streptomyces sp. NRRL F-5123]|uniref:hypothetical protein n=1 Tax=Streptomyces sp. NRRL F-5123 TaxID=1463856 RepID=UPI000A421F2B|nr:hypothetical protein [Streptomyces sp. NRRL F-5123]
MSEPAAEPVPYPGRAAHAERPAGLPEQGVTHSAPPEQGAEPGSYAGRATNAGPPAGRPGAVPEQAAEPGSYAGRATYGEPPADLPVAVPEQRGDDDGTGAYGEDAPARPEPLGVAVPATGNADVDAALARLVDADELPTQSHIEVYEDVHHGLRDALAALDENRS